MTTETEYYEAYKQVLSRTPSAQIEANKLAKWSKRKPLTNKYSWGILTREVADVIASYSPIIEIGSGSGYWAWEIEQSGGIVTCYDKQPDDWNTHWTTVHKGTPETIPEHKHCDTLLLCWPPANSPMAINAVHEIDPEHIIYAGKWYVQPHEKDTFVNGSNEFFEEMHANWRVVEKHAIPNWRYSQDSVRVLKQV